MSALDPDAAGFLAELKAADAPPLTAGTPDDARQANAEFIAAVGLKGPEVSVVEDLDVPTTSGSVRCRRYLPAGSPSAVVIYLHGGGWVIGDLDTLDGLCRLFAAQGACEVFSIDYRLAPEHPFPAALDDACDAARWISDHHLDGRPLVVAGDSSGGNLAAGSVLRLRDEAGPDVALQVLLYPVLDCDLTTPSYESFSEGYLLQRADMEWFWDHYIPRGEDRTHPYASPLRAADLSGLPATYIAVAGFDPLRDEGLAYARRLEEAGVEVTCRNYDSMIHGFVSIPGVLPKGEDAAGEIIGEVRGILDGRR